MFLHGFVPIIGLVLRNNYMKTKQMSFRTIGMAIWAT